MKLSQMPDSTRRAIQSQLAKVAPAERPKVLRVALRMASRLRARMTSVAEDNRKKKVELMKIKQITRGQSGKGILAH